VLELRFLDRRSVRDVAREMDVSVANAKVLQHRALRMAADIGEAQP
jgi:RNA polymerase sigma-70 factor (ECF subfamily)